MKKTKPIKIWIQSSEDKRDIRKRIISLKFSRKFAKNDMTKEEKLRNFQLYQSLKITQEKIQYKAFRKKNCKIAQQTYVGVLLTNASSVRGKPNKIQALLYRYDALLRHIMR